MRQPPCHASSIVVPEPAWNACENSRSSNCMTSAADITPGFLTPPMPPPPCAQTDRREKPQHQSVFAELLLQRVLGAIQHPAPRRRQVLARAVDVERQHRKRGAIRIRLAPLAVFG